MDLKEIADKYFESINDITHPLENTTKTNVLAVIATASIFTGVVPLGFAVLSLLGRAHTQPTISAKIKKINEASAASLFGISPTKEEVKGTSDDPRSRRIYPGDLSLDEKIELNPTIKGSQVELNIDSNFSVTIRAESIFDIQTEVIVNAANEELVKGGGIDNEIHSKGGEEYAVAHNNLRGLYPGGYVSGRATMISSGKLKEDYGIDNVIVVAAPNLKDQKTPPTKQQENELYSCYYNSLVLAHSEGKKSIAFPALGTGEFKFPENRAAEISTRAIRDFILDHPSSQLTTISIHVLPEETEKLNDYLFNQI